MNTERLSLKLNKSTKDEIVKRANKEGISVSKYVRMKCIEDNPKLWQKQEAELM